jgi:hypothetical protein
MERDNSWINVFKYLGAQRAWCGRSICLEVIHRHRVTVLQPSTDVPKVVVDYVSLWET